MRVTAVRKGYFGGKIRDAGEVFDLPDALMKTNPSWVEAVGEAGVASPEPETVNPADPATRKRGRKPKASSSPPSAEAPAERLRSLRQRRHRSPRRAASGLAAGEY